MSLRSEVYNKFSQYMGLNSGTGLEGDVTLAEFHYPLGEPAGELQLVEDALQ